MIFFREKEGILLLGKTIPILKELENEFVDLILTDPPYGTLDSREISQRVNLLKGDRTEHWKENNNWDLALANEFSWVDECDRILRKGGTFISYYDRDRINFLSLYLKNKGYKLRNYVVDILTNPIPRGGQLSWCNSVGLLGIWVKKWDSKEQRFTYNGANMGQHKEHFIYEEFEEENTGMVIRPILHGKERLQDQGKCLHPTQKPLQIMRDLVRYFSNEKNVVLDPFCGTATTCAAAKMYDRKYIGIDQDEKYLIAAKNRLQNVTTEII